MCECMLIYVYLCMYVFVYVCEVTVYGSHEPML